MNIKTILISFFILISPYGYAQDWQTYNSKSDRFFKVSDPQNTGLVVKAQVV
jgi:hypothetical protein